MSKRYNITFEDADHATLTEVSKRFKLSQPEVISILIKTMNVESLTPAFEEARNDKLKERSAAVAVKRGVIGKFKDLTPEQLAAIEAIVKGQQ